MEIKRLSITDIDIIATLFRDVFCKEPWNDDWRDEEQLHRYLTDLMGNNNSVAYGLYKLQEDGNTNRLIGLALGHIRHWYEGTEYFIDEFCIARDCQRQGCGKKFLRLMENELRSMRVKYLYLLTERDVPAYDFYRKEGFTEMKGNVAFAKEIF